MLLVKLLDDLFQTIHFKFWTFNAWRLLKGRTYLNKYLYKTYLITKQHFFYHFLNWRSCTGSLVIRWGPEARLIIAHLIVGSFIFQNPFYKRMIINLTYLQYFFSFHLHWSCTPCNQISYIHEEIEERFILLGYDFGKI